MSTEPADVGTGTARLVRADGGGIGALFEYFTVVARRYVKVSLFSQLGAPILYMLSLGVGLGSVVNSGGGSRTLGVSYLAFIAPALIAATALQVGVGEATYPILHGGFKYQRTYFAMNATPLTAAQISRGVLGWIAFRTGLAATFYLLVVLCFGGIRSAGAVLSIPVAVLGALALATPVAAYSASTESEGGGFAAIFRFIVTPMFLFSGTFYPINTLPEWARVLAWVSPLWHATELARWVSLGSLHLPSGVGHISVVAGVVHVLYLVALTVAGAVVTSWRFRVRLAK